MRHAPASLVISVSPAGVVTGVTHCLLKQRRYDAAAVVALEAEFSELHEAAR